jgi:hypothetical protein
MQEVNNLYLPYLFKSSFTNMDNEDKPKIKILDDSALRAKILAIVNQQSQIILANWAINCATHVTRFVPETLQLEVVQSGFHTNRLWQTNQATVHQVRQAGFRIHEKARDCKDEIAKNILRTVGQAVGVGHMSAHAMVCSDYAIKVMQLSTNNDLQQITKERIWQLNELKIHLRAK